MQKGFSTALIFIIFAFVAVLSTVYFTRPKTDQPKTGDEQVMVIDGITLSASKKNIVFGEEVLLSIDDPVIFDFFKTKSQLCDEANLNSTPDRKKFCTDKGVFKDQTRFKSIFVSPSGGEVGFVVESDALSPDTVVGIFHITREPKVTMLTNYYLRNEFISFSPSGKNFAYTGGCWEAMCGIVVKDSETLVEKVSLNNPKYIDERQKNATFVRWISDNSIEYKLGGELKQASF